MYIFIVLKLEMHPKCHRSFCVFNKNKFLVFWVFFFDEKAIGILGC